MERISWIKATLDLFSTVGYDYPGGGGGGSHMKVTGMLVGIKN